MTRTPKLPRRQKMHYSKFLIMFLVCFSTTVFAVNKHDFKQGFIADCYAAAVQNGATEQQGDAHCQCAWKKFNQALSDKELDALIKQNKQGEDISTSLLFKKGVAATKACAIK